ncbi:MAG: shikimate dehydrogenase [Saprospiraceae bacterium]|nr:shikimate dehydrogenase [Saprospiraceae bacterium]
MILYALIGQPLTHSFSKKYFTEKFEKEGIVDARYELFPLESIEYLPELLRQHPALCGLNVTIPYKESVIPYLDELDETAKAVGAVNCIQIKNGHLKGFNTDVIGFERSLNDFFDTPTPAQLHREALILGTGGAAKAVAFVLNRRGIPFKFVSRTAKGANNLSYSQLSGLKPCLIVHTTPLGTYPKTEEMPPVPKSLFLKGQIVYDLVYNPAETLLLREAKRHGAQTQNGLEMLIGQAEAAWKIWNEAEGR